MDQQPTPNLSCPSFLGPAQYSSAEQPTDNQLLAEQAHKAHTDGRQTGHYFANSVAKDNSQVHYGDNYNATHHHNHQGPDLSDDIPRSLEKAIARNKVEIYLDHVMKILSFEHMGLRKGTIAPALVNTCQWLLNSPEYISWRDPDHIHDHHGFMWIKSKAGAGKSTMMKFLIESARSQHSGDTVISFFFNARGDEMEKTLNGLYRHLLHQLMCSVSRLQYSMADDIYEIASQGWQPQPLKDTLRRAVLDLRSERFTCFIDALDESSEDEIRELIEFFEELGNVVVAKHIGFRVCFSSRHYPNVELEKCQYLNLDNNGEHENDIALYIKSKLKLRRGGISDDLPELVQKKAQGVFLWVVLVTQILKKDYDRGDIHKAHSRLESIPPGLHNLFHEMIHRSAEDPDDIKNLLAVLQWIAFARRPLTAEELYFAVRSEDPDFDMPQLWNFNGVKIETMQLFILNCSRGLAELTMDPSAFQSHRYTHVQFIHESVRNFLNETGFDILTPGRGVPLVGFAHNNLKECCLRWISRSLCEHVSNDLYEDTSNSLYEQSPRGMFEQPWSSLYEQLPISLLKQYHELTPSIQAIPLLTYSINNMITHAEMACKNGVPQENFLGSFPIKMWLALARSVKSWYMPRDRFALPPSLTEILAYEHVEALLKVELRRTGPHLLSHQYERPPRTALSQDAMLTSRLLLDNGAPPDNVVDQRIKAPLFAVDERKAKAPQLMFKCGKHAVPLHDYAAVSTEVTGRTDVVQVLLENYKVPTKANTATESAIQATFLSACLHGDEAVVNACLEKESGNPNVLIEERPLFHAVSAEGHDRILQTLLNHGADLAVAHGRHYYDALVKALRKGRDDIVHTLSLQRSASLPLPSRWYYWEVMDTLALWNRSDTIGALLDNVQGFRGQHRDVHLGSLRLAMIRGNDEVVRVFKDRGVTLLTEESLRSLRCAPHDARSRP